MTISNSTLTSDVFTDIRTELVAASITAESTSASIYAAFNDKTPTRPQIVIQPISVQEALFRIGGTEGKKFINVIIDCYYKNTAGLDEMYDQVVETVKAASFDDIELIAISSDYAFNTSNEQKFHMKSITFTFDRE